jgi:hypothetical protein
MEQICREQAALCKAPEALLALEEMAARYGDAAEKREGPPA